MSRWPNFFIVGAGKSGTSSLNRYLKDIPGIYMSPVKEPNYFSINFVFENAPNPKPIRSEEKYLNLFANAKDEKILGEASTPYLEDPEVPHLIYEKIPDARILISLRNPIEKVYSGYLMWKNRKRISDDFHEYVQKELKRKDPQNIKRKYLGLYYDNVKRYLEVFGIDQVKIIIFEEWVKDPKPTLNEILKFLGSTETLNNFKNVIYNPYRETRGPIAQYIRKNWLVKKTARLFLSSSSRKSLGRKLYIKNEKKPKMNKNDREELKKFHYDDVQKLQTLLGRELPWEDFQTKDLIP